MGIGIGIGLGMGIGLGDGASPKFFKHSSLRDSGHALDEDPRDDMPSQTFLVCVAGEACVFDASVKGSMNDSWLKTYQ